MARVRRVRRSATARTAATADQTSSFWNFFPQLRRFGNDILAADQDLLDYLLTAGLCLITLVVPFLYSRATTENFLTPKEFVAKISLAFLGAVFALRFIAYQQIRLVRTRLDFPMALFWGYCALSLLWNYNVPSAIRDLRGTFLILLLFPLIVNVIRRRWQLEGILWMAVIAGIATATLGVLETYNLYYRWDPALGWVFARDEIFAGRINPQAFYLPLFPQLASPNAEMGSVVSTFGNRNYLGTFVMFVAFIPFSFFFYYRNIFMKVLSLGVFGSLVFGMYITRCRAALVGLVIGFVFMIIMMLLLDRGWKLWRRPDTLGFLVATVLIGVAGFAFSVRTLQQSTNIMDKLKSTLTLDRLASNTYERIWIWYATHRSYSGSIQRWLVGQGFGSYKHFFPLNKAAVFSDDNKETFTAVTFRQAHNDWLQIISELGMFGLLLFLFLTHRFLSMIYYSCRDDIWSPATRRMGGDHLLLIGLSAGMVSQLVAAGPDFPFHRIETAFYAVIFLGLITVLADSRFFRQTVPSEILPINPPKTIMVGGLAVLTGLLAISHEANCWQADILVREADMSIRQNAQATEIVHAKQKLHQAIAKDPLPGDPHLKLATILEMEGQVDAALEATERAQKNINFNARSTYHSVAFRQMHTLYHIAAPLRGRGSVEEAQKIRAEALQMASHGQHLTCGEARPVYYFYIGRIAMDLGLLEKAEWALSRAAKFPQYAGQVKANLAILKASMQKWQEAYDIAVEVNTAINETDPTILNIIGVSASNLGQNATAEAALRKAISKTPAQPVYKRDLGVVLLRRNNFPEARAMFEAASREAGTNERLKVDVDTMLASMTAHEMALVQHYWQQNKREEARQVLQQMSQATIMTTTIRDQVQQLLAQLDQIPTGTPMLPEQPPMLPEQPPVFPEQQLVLPEQQPAFPEQQGEPAQAGQLDANQSPETPNVETTSEPLTAPGTVTSSMPVSATVSATVSTPDSAPIAVTVSTPGTNLDEN